VAAQFQQMDALVLPSISTPRWKEQFGRVLVEAMIHGVPVVGSTSGEIPKVIGEAGLVFPEGDVTALRDCLHRLLDDSALAAALVRRGWERAWTAFSNRSIADRTAAVYRALLTPGSLHDGRG
jgi:glycosyltransferase involved in cell wall biosynthesis